MFVACFAVCLVLMLRFVGAQEAHPFPIGLAYPQTWPTGEPRRGVPPYIAAYQLAIKHLNEDLPYNFTALPMCDTKHSILQGFECAMSFHGYSPLGIVGASYSSVSLHMVVITTQHMVLQCSGASTSPDLSDLEYRYFFRTVPPDDARAEGIVQMLYFFGWHRAVVVHTTDRFGAGLAEKLGRARPQETTSLEMKFLGVEPDFYRVLSQAQLKALEWDLTYAIRASQIRIVIPVLLHNNIVLLVKWCTHRLLMGPGYVWIGIDAFNMFTDADIVARMDNETDIDFPNRSHFVDFMWVTPRKETTSRTARLMADSSALFGVNESGSFSNHFYDCVTAIGLAANVVLQRNRTLTPQMLVQGDQHAKNQLRDAAFDLEFEGASGFVQFKKPNTAGAGDRLPTFSILRWRIEAVWEEVGIYKEIGNEATLEFTGNLSFSSAPEPLKDSWEGCPKGQQFDLQQSLETNQDVCMRCPVGRYKEGTSRHECDVCLPGYRCSEGATELVACEAGSFSHKGNDTCSECPPGTYSDSKGSSQCIACSQGFFQTEASQTSCNACKQGKFQSQNGRTGCTECPPTRSTYSSGTPSEAGCGCQAGTRWVSELQRCEECSEGMNCSSFNSTARVAAGYYLQQDEPRDRQKMELFRCNVASWCPGETNVGDPMCADHREGLCCGMCVPGYYESGLTCVECTDTHTLYYVSVLLGLLLLCGVVQYLWVSKTEQVEVSEGLLFSLTAGTTLAVLQKLGVIGRIGVAWPEGIKEVLGWCSAVFVKFVVLTPSCAWPPSLFSLYLARLFTPMLAVLGCSLWWVASHLLHRYISKRIRPLDIYQAVNTMGLFLSALYIYAAIGTLSLVDCYQSPNGRRTIREFSFSLCSGPEFNSTLPLFILGIAVYIVGLVGVTLYALWVAPTKYRRTSSGFRMMIRFLVYKFRPNKYWFGLVTMMGQFLMALTPVVFPDSNVMQFLTLGLIVAALLFAHCIHVPYTQSFANRIENAEYLGLLALLGLGTFFLEELNQEGKRNMSIAMVVIVMVMGSLVLGAFGWGFYLAVFRTRTAALQQAQLDRQLDSILAGCQEVVRDSARFRLLLSREASYVERESAARLMQFFHTALSEDTSSVRSMRRLFLSLREHPIEVLKSMSLARSMDSGRAFARGNTVDVVGDDDAKKFAQQQGVDAPANDPPGFIPGPPDTGFFLGPSKIIKITM